MSAFFLSFIQLQAKCKEARELNKGKRKNTRSFTSFFHSVLLFRSNGRRASLIRSSFFPYPSFTHSSLLSSHSGLRSWKDKRLLIIKSCVPYILLLIIFCSFFVHSFLIHSSFNHPNWREEPKGRKKATQSGFLFPFHLVEFMLSPCSIIIQLNKKENNKGTESDHKIYNVLCVVCV